MRLLDDTEKGGTDKSATGGANVHTSNDATGGQISSLRRTGQPYHIILEKISEGAVTLSADGVIVYCNQRFADMVEQPVDQLTGSDFLRFLKPHKQAKYKVILRHSFNQIFSEELEFKIKKNTSRHYRLSFTCLPSQTAGEICVVISSSKENHELKRTY